jgi:hypothetical protein
MRHRPLTKTLNECANASETVNRIESEKMTEHANGCESKIGIENKTMTEYTNGSESENRIVNRSTNKNSIAKSHTFSVKPLVDPSLVALLLIYSVWLTLLGDRSQENSAQETLPRSTPFLGADCS